MNNELVNIKLSENNTIKSTDLVNIINEFRAVEGKVEMLHKDFMKKIRKELEVLESLGLEGQGNFSPSSYVNSQNKEQPCFELTRDGMLEILNSESTLVRYKTIEYVNSLEKEVEELQQDNKALYSIAVSPEELAKRQYEADKTKYSFRNIAKVINSCTYATLEDEINKIMEVHTHLKKNDRCEYHRELNRTEYKQRIREYVCEKLEAVIPSKDTLFMAVANKLEIDLHKDLLTTTKKSTSQYISNKDKAIGSLADKIASVIPEEDEYVTIPIHGFSVNSTNTIGECPITRQAIITKSNAYFHWIQKFDALAPLLDAFSHIDFTKPVHIYAKYGMMEKYDSSNFTKSLLDRISSYFKVDDKMFYINQNEPDSYCDDVKDGYIKVCLKN